MTPTQLYSNVNSPESILCAFFSYKRLINSVYFASIGSDHFLQYNTNILKTGCRCTTTFSIEEDTEYFFFKQAPGLFLTFLIKRQTFGYIYLRNYTDDSQFIPRLAAIWYFVCVQPHLGILRHAYRIHTRIPISCIPT